MYQIQILLRKQLKAAWRYRWPAVLVSWLVCALGWFGVMRIPDTYESTARLYIDADAILTPLLQGLTVSPSLASQVEVLQRTLLSRPNLDRLISKTDLELQASTPAERQALIDRLQTEIRIMPQSRNLFTFSYRNQSPKLAFDIVQATLTQFIESKAGTNRTDLENASRFLETQLGVYERQLRDAERRRAEFRARYVELLPNTDGAVNGVDAAAAAVRSLEGQLQDAQARRATLAKELAATPPLLVTEADALSEARAGRLSEAERKLAELRMRFTDAHPDVVAQREIVAALRAGQLGPEPTSAQPRSQQSPRNRSVPNPVYEQMKVRLVDTDSNIASLERQRNEAIANRDRLDAMAKAAPGVYAESLNIDRDYAVLRKNYDELIARRESMRISAAAENSADKVKIQVIDPPLVPQYPIAPKRGYFLTGVLIAGLAAGLGMALLLVQLDQSFHTTDDLRNLGYPVVGGVSFLAASVPVMRRAVTVGTFLLAVCVPCVVYGGLIVHVLKVTGGVGFV
jgi:polysaccharide chain length determinant protein (PEP-CTERM system associated)